MYEWRASLNRSIAMQGQQAKMVRPTQERAILGYLATTRALARDRVLCLFSMKAGLRAKAMASLTWAMVTDATGQGRGRRCSMDPTASGRGRPAAAPFRCTPTSRPRWARCRGFSFDAAPARAGASPRRSGVRCQNRKVHQYFPCAARAARIPRSQWKLFSESDSEK